MVTVQNTVRFIKQIIYDPHDTEPGKVRLTQSNITKRKASQLIIQ